MSVLKGTVPISRIFKGGTGAHLHWRVLMLNNYGSASYIGLSEIEMRAADGGADLCTGGTATASDPGTGGSTGGPETAFDDNLNTACILSGTTNEWIAYEFPSPVEVNQLALTTTSLNALDRIMRDGKLQYSDDGSTWTDAFEFTWDAPLPGATRTFPQAVYASGYSRGWRINVTANGGDTYTYIQEMELRATSGGADQTAPVPSNSNGDATGRAVGTAPSPWGMFDNSSGHWGHVTSLPTWGGIFLPSPIKVEEIAITNLSSISRSPADFTLDYLEADGVTWTTQKSWTGVTWSSSSETKVLTAV